MLFVGEVSRTGVTLLLGQVLKGAGMVLIPQLLLFYQSLALQRQGIWPPHRPTWCCHWPDRGLHWAVQRPGAKEEKPKNHQLDQILKEIHPELRQPYRGNQCLNNEKILQTSPCRMFLHSPWSLFTQPHSPLSQAWVHAFLPVQDACQLPCILNSSTKPFLIVSVSPEFHVY